MIAEETIWSCTTCSACVDVCPLGVDPLGFIMDMRRHLIADSQLRGAPAVALKRIDGFANPWGFPIADRLAWATGLKVPTTAENPGFEVLYWVGCAAAYDQRSQRIARSVVKLLTAAGVNFAVLGPLERCTGESARRMGDELLFQKLAASNIDTFGQLGIQQRERRIVAHCPHCVNSLKLDYSQLGAELDVVHHSVFLAELLRDGRLTVAPDKASTETVTYHDPCYLSRAWGITEAPRDLMNVSTADGSLVEMPRRGQHTSCCGAGGGRMWFDDPAESRVGASRVNEALETGAKTLAVACPFCLTMLSDGVAARGGQMAVRDVSELLADAIV